MEEITGQAPTYKGIKDSHPYQVEALPRGSWAVAEAAGNAILWVSTLPGGPEDPSLGARGSVYKINRNGVRRVATGFLGATDLALAGGKVYVAELFHNRVSTIKRGRIVTARSIPRPLSVEGTRRHLYGGQMADVDFETGEPKSPGGIYRFRR